MTHYEVPIWTYILDATGAFGLIVGGYVASKSVYSRENSKDAALLIDTQRKRIDSLLEENKKLRKDMDEMRIRTGKMEGRLEEYMKLQTVDPKIITQLMTTQNKILLALKDKKNGR